MPSLTNMIAYLLMLVGLSFELSTSRLSWALVGLGALFLIIDSVRAQRGQARS